MTAEYSLLPASTGERTEREASRGKQGGRTIEIQRLIGRALRSVCDFNALGERTLWLDCDVLQADGGTRCAAISGAYVAAHRALDRFGLSKALTGSVAAVSVGIVEGRALLDLDYAEDSTAETDMNVVMTADGRLVEVQATAERDPFSRDLLDDLLDLAARRDRGDHGRAGRGHRRRRVPELSTAEALLRLLLAAGLGGAIGLERELRDHEAGFRTHLIVSLGACVFTLVSAYGWTDWTFSTAHGRRLRPDPDRGADRDRDRLPRRRRDHRPRDLRPRPDDGGDALGRGRDRDGRRHRLLRGRGRRGGARARLARPAQARQRAPRLAGPAGGGGARDPARAGRRGDAGAGPDRGARRAGRLRRVRGRPHDRRRPARLAPGGVGACRGAGAKLEDVERVQWRP